MSDALDDVLGEAATLGFLSGGRTVDHRRHAEAFVPLVDGDGPIVDLGTGGGVPGLVLAVVFAERRVVMVERRMRCAAFLDAAVARLGLDRATVVASEAEIAAGDHAGVAEVVTARSFGPPAVTAECAAPFLAEGGRLVVSEPPGGNRQRWPAAGVAALGLELTALHPGPPALAVLTRRHAPTRELPRAPGVARRHPLF